ncbi:response regulator [Chengkuizengella axinellae]|uniref:Response regulator transcription factor n=1 Tax=Chengkuizengella axinellae TaxID=3064388 RepID=A0ABT9IZ03_9BACL|nr:response regulator transcription factor [Chengkuizengella sp. 2205SS18-9]MDP5274601.1 response regulator transcription factor [Chengkuizengella sp. 2205SS18-9]
MIRVMITASKNQKIIVEGIKQILERDEEIEVIASTSNKDEMMKCCEHLLPDVVLMDDIMLNFDVMEAIRSIKTKFETTQVIILTENTNDTNIVNAFIHGANGYMLKETNSDELIMAIKSAAVGLSVIYKKSSFQLMQLLHDANSEYQAESKMIDVKLTDRELSIIKHIVNGMENKEIAKNLYISEGTVKNAVSKILKKLELCNRIQLVVYAMKNDLLKKNKITYR